MLNSIAAKNGAIGSSGTRVLEAMRTDWPMDVEVWWKDTSTKNFSVESLGGSVEIPSMNGWRCRCEAHEQRWDDAKFTTDLLLQGWTALRIQVGIFTGDSWLNRHIFNLRLAEEGACRLCLEEMETSEHIRRECKEEIWNIWGNIHPRIATLRRPCQSN